MHDDSCFTELFPANLRRTLSMSALHAGAPGVNWNSRASTNYSSTTLPVERHDLSTDLANVLDQNYCNSSFTAVMIGYYPGGLASQLARRAKRLYMIDQFRIHHDTSNPMLRADRATLRACLNEELDTFGTAVFLGAHSADNIATISDGSVDFLYLTGAIPSVCETLIEALPKWLPKLSQDAIICGDSFAHSEWATGVTALFWLFGKPDHVETSGFWWKRLTPEIRNLHRRSDPTPDEKQNGVILVHVKEGDIEPLLLSIHSARAHWDGPIKVYYRGKDADPLRLACWRLRCDLHHLGAELPDLPLDGMDLLSVAALLPYQFALLLRSGMLVNGPLSLFFSEPIPAGASVAKGAISRQYIESDFPVVWSSAGCELRGTWRFRIGSSV
jgi:hypothetical protein